MTLADKCRAKTDVSLGCGYEERESRREREGEQRERDRRRIFSFHGMMAVVAVVVLCHRWIIITCMLAWAQDQAFPQLLQHGTPWTCVSSAPFQHEAKLEQRTCQFMISRINHTMNAR
jgi:hypothetical protein